MWDTINDLEQRRPEFVWLLTIFTAISSALILAGIVFQVTDWADRYMVAQGIITLPPDSQIRRLREQLDKSEMMYRILQAENEALLRRLSRTESRQ